MTGMCISAANHLIKRTNAYNAGKPYSQKIIMSCKRLQKLLFFSDVLYMQGHGGTSMFNDDFNAWPSGPVIPEIYDEFVQYQTGDMLPIDETNHLNLTPEMTIILDEIFDRTVNISALTLVKASHIPGGPWDQVYEENDEKHKQIISKSSMYEFYKGMSLEEILTPKVD